MQPSWGTQFESALEHGARRRSGAYYTPERLVLEVVRPLFVDRLRARLAACAGDVRSLVALHEAIARVRLFDPACGCGDFLGVAYRELRELERDVIRALGRGAVSRVGLHQVIGIEIEEGAARRAVKTLEAIDGARGGSPRIVRGNALRVAWSEVLAPSDDVYVLGNPPFAGKKEQTAAQKRDLARVWRGVRGAGVLDYVTCWLRLAAAYVRGTRARVGFVATSSIVQGEQVAPLWRELVEALDARIAFAHRPFPWKGPWQGASRATASVHVVIVVFGAFEPETRAVVERDACGDARVSRCANVNAYLVDAPNVYVASRARPINGARPMRYGSMTIDRPRAAGDDQGLVVTDVERDLLLAECPRLAPYVRPFLGGEELLGGSIRHCLWLVGAPASLADESPRLRARVAKVRAFRRGSRRAQTRSLASTPTLFGEIRQPSTRYLALPKVSSENRAWLPSAFVEPDVIASGSALVIPDATLYDFGVLSSTMHAAWFRHVAGRLESRYQYSSQVVYNNFPWPESVSPLAQRTVEGAVAGVLAARARSPGTPLGELYDAGRMPAALAAAHAALDVAVDRLYHAAPFADERARAAHLFALYARLTAAPP